jgi:hypothetical protein
VAPTSDDDVSKAATTGHDDSDGDTTAAAVAKRVPKLGGDEEEDRTVQQKVDRKIHEPQRNVLRAAAARAPVTLAAPTLAAHAPIRMTSKKPTAVGLGAPPANTRPAAGYEPPKAPVVPAAERKSPPPIATQSDDPDDSVTATSPAPRISDTGAPLPITLPGDVKITEIIEPRAADEPLDETEVRTLIVAPSGAPPKRPAAPPPAAGVPARATGSALPVPNEADEPDDSITAQAPSPIGLFNDDDDLKTSPPRLAPQPMPAAGRRPSDPRTVAAPARAPVEYGEDESVTAQARVAPPDVPAALHMAPAFEDRSAHRAIVGAGVRARVGSSPDVGAVRDAPSITAEAAPGHHLSDMLRVIGGPPVTDEMEENHTAVMFNAPVKPPLAMTSAAVRGGARSAAGPHAGRPAAAIADLRAELREPSSDSGLRVARAEVPSGDHANVDVLMAGGAPLDGGPAPTLESPNGRGPNPFAKTEKAFNVPSTPRGVQPSLHEFDFAATIKKPRYGLLVGFVAVLSFAIPMVLFVVLHSGSSDVPQRDKAELQADRVVRGDALRVKAGAVPKGSASDRAASSASGRRNEGFPRRR